MDKPSSPAPQELIPRFKYFADLYYTDVSKLRDTVAASREQLKRFNEQLRAIPITQDTEYTSRSVLINQVLTTVQSSSDSVNEVSKKLDRALINAQCWERQLKITGEKVLRQPEEVPVPK